MCHDFVGVQRYDVALFVLVKDELVQIRGHLELARLSIVVESGQCVH